MKTLGFIGALIALTSIIGYSTAYFVGSTAAAVGGINALFGWSLSPWVGPIACVVVFAIYFAAVFMLGDE